MRKIFLLAIMLTGCFAFSNNFTPNVSSEINKETETFTQTDVLSVKSDVILDYQYQIEENSLSFEDDDLVCYTRDCIIYNGRKHCTGWQQVTCPKLIVIIIVVE